MVTNATGQADIVLSVGIALKGIKKEMSAARRQIRNNLTIGKDVSAQLKNFEVLESKMTRIKKAFASNKVEFAGWAMSIMFFGMAIQRVFTQIWKTSTKTFQDVMHSVEGTVTGFDLLQGSVKFLGFSVGQSLEPIAMQLIPIIDKMSDWVSENEKLAGEMVKWGIILGGIFAVGGSGVLAINGFIDLAGKINALRAASFAAEAAFQVLKVALGAGILLYVGYQLFGKDKDKPFTTWDWLKNLGLASIGGYMVGGPWGALAAFAITLVVMVSQSAMKESLKQVAAFVDAKNKLLSGEILTAEEANRIAFEGTVAPKAMLEEQARKNAEMMRSLTGSTITSTEGETRTFEPIIIRDIPPVFNIYIDNEQVNARVIESINTTG
jgi:hypothetical protein